MGHVELHELLATNPQVSDANEGMFAVLIDAAFGNSAPEVCMLVVTARCVDDDGNGEGIIKFDSCVRDSSKNCVNAINLS